MTKTPQRILVVDDEPPLLKMIGAYLGRLGYAVTTLGSTEKAAAEIEAAPGEYSVAVLDATMSGIGVEELASKIMASSPGLCVIVASGYPMDITALDAAAPRRVMFLHKPFTPEMLARAVRRMLGTKEKGV
jgi:DNA-binding NtrC family response regulator